MMPAENCEGCGKPMTAAEQLDFLFLCQECFAEELAYLAQLGLALRSLRDKGAV